MQIIITIKDSRKAKAFLNFIKSLDFITVKESKENSGLPIMTKEQIINRVAVTNKQIQKGETISHDDLYKESKNW